MNAISTLAFIMRWLTLFVLFELFSPLAAARDMSLGLGWVLIDAPVIYRDEMAGLCSGAFFLTVSQPKEPIGCNGLLDTQFLADLKLKKVYWSRSALAGIASSEERRIDFENVYQQLKSGGLETLENMRAFYYGP